MSVVRDESKEMNTYRTEISTTSTACTPIAMPSVPTERAKTKQSVYVAEKPDVEAAARCSLFPECTAKERMKRMPSPT